MKKKIIAFVFCILFVVSIIPIAKGQDYRTKIQQLSVLLSTIDSYSNHSAFFYEQTNPTDLSIDGLCFSGFISGSLNKTDDTSYYISITGSDNNIGSFVSPWRTIQKAADMVTQGDTVYIRGGTYREKITLSYAKGTSTSWITFKPYNSESVVVDASGLSGRYDGIFLFKDGCSYIRITGLEIKGANNHGFFLYGGEISNIRIDHCVIHDCESSGIYCISEGQPTKYVRNVEFDYNTVYDVNNGLSAYGASVSPQEAISFSNVQGFNIHHNILRSFGKEGIDCKSGSSNGEIHHNTINNSLAPPAFQWDWHHIGIYIDGFSRKNHDISVYCNTITGYGGSGIVIGAEEGGSIENIFIYNNIITLSTLAGHIHYRGIDSFDDCVWKNIYIYYNTIDTGDSSNSALRIYPLITDITDLVIANNIFAGSTYYLIYFQKIRSTEVTNRITITSNLYYRFGGTGHNKWYDGDDKSWGSDYIIKDPEFIDRNAYDLHLQSSSPAIDNGLSINALSVDFDGIPRPQGTAFDIGAYEYRSENNPPNKPFRPLGKITCKINTSYQYQSSSIDIDGDQIYYLFDWGDGTNSGWKGPYDSGQICKILHKWNIKSLSVVKVKVKDIMGKESPWSDPLPILTLNPNNLLLQIYQWFFERFLNPPYY